MRGNGAGSTFTAGKIWVECESFSTRFFSLWLAIVAGLSSFAAPLHPAEPEMTEGDSTREVRQIAARQVPLQRLPAALAPEVRAVLESPSFFRRMPTQQIDCDPEMFTFLVRRPEVMVNIWDLMGITKVTAHRTAPHSFFANDGMGTACKCDLIYSDAQTHVYMGTGEYAGSMTPRNVTGRCVCVLHTESRPGPNGRPEIVGTMDVFLKLDNFGADLLTRTIGPFVGKTADYNFMETAKFISQICQVCRQHPDAAIGLAMQLSKVDESTRREFADLASRLSSEAMQADLRAFESSPTRRIHTNIEPHELVPQPRPAQVASQSPPQDQPAHVGRSLRDRHPAPLGALVRQSQHDPASAQRPTETSRPSFSVRPLKANVFMRR